MTWKIGQSKPVDESFKTPPALYRGAPFWSWNGKLEKDELLRQIDVFKRMGIGGYHIHSRTGLNTEYLGDEFMELIKACRDHGKEQGMLTWLYDEDRWPSGAAGGLVTKDPRHRMKQLLLTQKPYAEEQDTNAATSAAKGSRQGKGILLASYALRLKDKHLAGYRILADGDSPEADETLWYAYQKTVENSSWFNGQAYVDTLSKEAIQRFIEVTHERYKEAVGNSFGSDIPAIFTDEPQFSHKRTLSFAEEQKDLILPWTSGLDEAFCADYGESILAHLPEVIWDLPNNSPSVWRYRYHEWVAERFARCFADQIGDWCESNGIALTGHMMMEESLTSQTKALGDAMRSYRGMQIPGIDILCDRMELSTAKQAQSAARQFGRAGVLSELYGVTGWHYDFFGHKRQGDWQAALGVLFRVHHLSWYCMRGEAKRDYPASINYQSPWHREYPIIEDHFARVGALLSRGTPVCRIAVLHPVESYWLCAGPNDTSHQEQAQREQNFAKLIEWLLYGTLDFDFVAESLLPDQPDTSDDSRFGVGQMRYEAVLVPGMKTMRSSTVERLEAFADDGGRILFAGEIPSLVDALPSDRVAALAARCETLAYDRVAILSALENHRDIGFLTRSGTRPDNLLYQMRQEGEERYLFVCNTSYNWPNSTVQGKLSMRGEYEVTSMQTQDGSSIPVAASYQEGQTTVDMALHAADHALLRLTPGRRTEGQSLLPPGHNEAARLQSPVAITLDEPNVLLFEKAEFAINDGEWQGETQMLDLENLLRAEIGLPKKEGHIAQPWTDPTPPQELARITLRMQFESRVRVAGAQLALENSAESAVTLDGIAVNMTPSGYFTDKAISTLALPEISAGSHSIEIRLSFTKETSIEWVYLLGDFGVTIEGTHGVLTSPVRALSFGDWTSQGLPFYGGNVTYHCRASADGSSIQCPQFHGTTLKICSQAETATLYRPPFTADIPLKEGEPLDITLFGHRANCFGPVHLAVDIPWLGPNSYRTGGAHFSPEYKLKPLGLGSAPLILQKQF